jgi:hypothetical protein
VFFHAADLTKATTENGKKSLTGKKASSRLPALIFYTYVFALSTVLLLTCSTKKKADGCRPVSWSGELALV